MSGIAGWIGYDADPCDASVGLGPVLDAMYLRGRGRAEVRAYRHAVLGHRSSVPDGTSGQPLVWRDNDDDVAVAVCDGEIDNSHELGAELQARGHRPRTGTGVETALLAYLEWGDGLAEHLRGRYAIAIWDLRREQLLLVRDRLGVRPLHYQATPDGVVFASTPVAILAGPRAEPAVDLDGLRELLGFIKTPGTGVFRGIREVAPGHLVRVRADGITQRRYWQLSAQEHRADAGATASRLRELLDQAVRRQLVVGGEPTALLSGLDSSVITALAQRMRNESGGSGDGRKAMRSIAVRFEIPAGGRMAGPADPFLHELATHIGTEHREITVNALRLASPGTRTDTLAARGLPPLGDFDTSLYLVFQAVGQHTSLSLSGDGADELFGGYYWCHDPAAVAAGTFPWTDLTSGYDRFASLLKPDLAAALDLATYRADRYAQAIADVPALPGQEADARRMREIVHLHLTRFFPIVLDRADAMAAAGGVATRVPFSDHDLVQYAFNVPWELQTRAGPKSLLRAATGDLLPAGLTPPASDHRPAPHAGNLPYHRALCESVRAVISDPGAPVRALLHAPAVQALLAVEPAAALLDRMETELDLIAGLNAWLDSHRLRLAW